MGAWAIELCAVERMTAAEQKLDTAKAHLVETKAALRKSLDALEVLGGSGGRVEGPVGRASKKLLHSRGRCLGQRSLTIDCSRG